MDGKPHAGNIEMRIETILEQYQTEFPDFELDVELPEGFEWVDASWHNDTCPSWTDHENNLKLWIDYKDTDKRECEGSSRVSRCVLNNDGEVITSILDTDDYNLVLEYCKRIK